MLLKNIFGFLWRALKALNTAVFGVIAIFLVLGLLAALAEQDGPTIPDGGALLLKPVGALVEQKTAVDPMALLQGATPDPETLVSDLLDALELAAKDERIKLVVLDLDEFGGALLPKLERVALALDNFRASGKKIVSISSNYNQSDLILAAHTDEILLNPEGSALMEGFGFFRTYYHSLLQEYDVSINLFKVGKYKSALEPFFRDNMSEEDKEARRGIIDNWWQAYTANVESARELPSNKIDDMMHDAPAQVRASNGNLAELALEMNLVDRVLTRDEQRDYLIELAGKDEDTHNYQHIPFGAYLAEAREPDEPGKNRIAVITGVGTIVDGQAKAGSIGGDTLSALIRKARRSDDLKAIVLRVDSGGGSKSASEIIRRELEAAQEDGIPVVASMGSLAASGGYWISATADEIWALPTTLTGSIGIFGFIPTFEKTLARYGINGDGVGTTPLTGGASVDRGISPAMGEIIQTVIEAGYQQFLETVGRGRNMTPEAVNEIAQGRVWSGSKAQELGLVDHLGDLDQAIASAAKLAGVDDYSVWHLKQELSPRERFIQNLLTSEVVARVMPDTDPVSQLTNKLRRELGILQQFNDPNHAYVLCGDCPL